MEQWRNLILKVFGRRGRHKWLVAATDFLLVDKGIKPVCLFDHWGTSAQDMQTFVSQLSAQKLTQTHLSVVSIGLDLIIYSSKFVSFYDNCDFAYIDVSSSLDSPAILGPDCDKISSTMRIFDKTRNAMGAEEEKNKQVYEVEIPEEVNVTSLFGVLLGYSCVYWYSRTDGENNCLSSCELRLFQVKGRLNSSGSSETSSQDNDFSSKANSGAIPHYHVVFSFSVPENLTSNLLSHVEEWFIQWKNSVNWSLMFSEVWMENETVRPQAVCL